jgi:hypothetical protein
MSSGYTLGDTDLSRISKMLRSFEGGNLSRRQAGDDGTGGMPILTVVRVTGAAVSGLYPAVIDVYDESAGTWSVDDADGVDVKVRELNAGTLTTQRYLARYAGVNASDQVVYLTIAGGGSGGSGSVLTLDFVVGISCLAGVFRPVFATVCIPNGYYCTTTTTTTTSAPTSSTSSTSSTTTTTTSTGGP